MRAVRRGGATEAASVLLQRKDLMHRPRLPDLFEALVVVYATANAIEVLRNNGMICLREVKPIHRDVAVIANVRAHHQADLGGSKVAGLDQARQISQDHVGSGCKTFRRSEGEGDSRGQEEKEKERETSDM